MSHWVFAAQYLRTSLILPEMLKQSLLKAQMTLFDKKLLESSETDFMMNHLSQQSAIKEGSNMGRGSELLRRFN